MFDDLLNKKFKDFGRGPDEYDCYGLALEVSNRFGKYLPDYGSLVSKASRQIQDKVGKYKNQFDKIYNPEKGDLVLISDGRFDCHIGIVISRGIFIHIKKDCGVQQIRFNHPLYKSRIRGFYRYVG